MNWLIVLIGLLSATAGLAQQMPPKKPADSLWNQDNMPVVPNRGAGSTMPVLKRQGDALPMPNAYRPMTEGDQREEALRAIQDQFNTFKAGSILRQKQRTPPPAPKKFNR